MSANLILNQFGLTDQDLENINSTFSKYPAIEQAIIFGSRAKGNYKDYSDVDITLIGIDLDLTTLQSVEGDLDDLLLPYKFDLSLLHEIENSDLLSHLNRVGRVFYSQK